jgi:hypothetical protein
MQQVMASESKGVQTRAALKLQKRLKEEKDQVVYGITVAGRMYLARCMSRCLFGELMLYTGLGVIPMTLEAVESLMRDTADNLFACITPDTDLGHRLAIERFCNVAKEARPIWIRAIKSGYIAPRAM